MIEDELRQEIEKWYAKAVEKRKLLRLVDDAQEDFLKNIDAYLLDSRHFLKQNDLIRSFEAVVWAWSIMEICLELRVFADESAKNHG